MELEKLIGKDLKQAERYAESLDKSLSAVQKELMDLEQKQKELIIKAGDLAEKQAAAHNYVLHLQKL